MVIVADTSPINYLVAPAVVDELTHPAAPSPVRDWTERHPGWLEVMRPKNTVALTQLDLGESPAIALASELGVAMPTAPDWSNSRKRSLACGKSVSVYPKLSWPKLN